MRSRRSRGRRGGDVELFARIPESAMLSEAGKTLPHAAFKVLNILVMGKVAERNGTMMCTDSYALRFGLKSRQTLQLSLRELEARGFIVRVRQGMKMRKVPTLWAVTWWPIYYREGQPLSRPEPASHLYMSWKKPPVTPSRNAQSEKSFTPTVGVQSHPPSVSIAIPITPIPP